jgi:membrane protease YdiL (CAAX protease family)
MSLAPGQRRDVRLYFLLAYAITWTCHLAIPLVGAPLEFDAPGLGMFLYLLGFSGPLAAALIVSTRRAGRAGIRDQLRAMVRWRFAWWWYAVAALGIPALTSVSIALHVASGGSAPSPWSAVPPPGLVLMQAWIVLGEEPGWRGFALPRLQERFGSLGASMILGVLWAAWHLPSFFIPGAPQYGSSFGAFTLFITVLTVILSVLYDRTGGSVLACMIFHASMNLSASSLRLPPDLPGWLALLWLPIIVGVVWLLPRPWFSRG